MSIFSKSKKRENPQKENIQKQTFLGDNFNIRMNWLKEAFNHCADIKFHELTSNNTKCGIVYLQGMVDQQLFDEQVLKYIVAEDFASSHHEFIHKLLDLKLFSTITNNILTDMQQAAELVLEGNILIFFDGDSRMLAFPVAEYEKRTIGQPVNENVIRGPREAFVEDINTNITMIRRRIKSPDLKMEQLAIGKYTKTTVMIGYIKGLCKPELIDEVKQRISRIKIDGVLGSSYLEECMDDQPYSFFPQAQKTERPDVVSAALLEGRAVIFIDGSPYSINRSGQFLYVHAIC